MKVICPYPDCNKEVEFEDARALPIKGFPCIRCGKLFKMQLVDSVVADKLSVIAVRVDTETVNEKT